MMSRIMSVAIAKIESILLKLSVTVTGHGELDSELLGSICVLICVGGRPTAQHPCG
jgi:hypothetical protein